MPAVARAASTDSVTSLTGAGTGCNSPLTTTTGIDGSPNVFVNTKAVVRETDIVGDHVKSGCILKDTSMLTTFSSTVFVNGLGIGRLGDKYTDDNIITSGSSNVFAGG
jgi:uncharacterized Zn-binding protein involved in type VI secretion